MRHRTDSHTPRPMEFTIRDFKDGRPITYRVVGGVYFHRLGSTGEFVSTGSDSYCRAAAHARHHHGVTAPFGEAAA